MLWTYMFIRNNVLSHTMDEFTRFPKTALTDCARETETVTTYEPRVRSPDGARDT